MVGCEVLPRPGPNIKALRATANFERECTDGGGGYNFIKVMLTEKLDRAHRDEHNLGKVMPTRIIGEKIRGNVVQMWCKPPGGAGNRLSGGVAQAI